MPRLPRQLLGAIAALALLVPLAVTQRAQADTHTLTVVKLGFQTGTVTSSPAGIVCGSTCTNSFTDPLVTLTTTLPTGFTVSWEGLTCQGNGETQTGSSCTVAPNDGTITAHYIDATAPTISLTSPSSSGPFHGSIQLAASAFDSQSGISRVDFTVGASVVGSDATSPYEMNFDTSTLPDGQVSVGAVAFNGDGQAKTANPLSITVDNTPPSVAITSGPDGETYGPGTTQTFTFTATDTTTAVTVCSLDSDQQFSECKDSASYTDQPEGLHTFRVRAVDSAGNQAEASRTFAIDRTGPTTTITGGPADFSSDTLGSVVFTFGASEDGVSFACRLYPGGARAPDYGPCSGPGTHSATSLAPGDWTFEVFATDAFGNPGPVAARHFSVVFGGTGIGGPGSDTLKPVISAKFTVRGRATTVRRLRVGRVPTGTRVTITCRGRSCRFRSRTRSPRGGHVVLEHLFKRRALRNGTLLELRITAAGLNGRVIRFKTRRGRQPLRSALCLPAGSKTPAACG